jgi:hypothetical protein
LHQDASGLVVGTGVKVEEASTGSWVLCRN